MKMQTTNAGSTGVRRVRSLFAFRHNSPVARLVSLLAALAMAALLVGSGGAAYAGNDKSSGAQASSAAPSDDATAEQAPAAAEETAAPAADQSTAADASTDNAGGSQAEDAKGKGDTAASEAPAGNSSGGGGTTQAAESTSGGSDAAVTTDAATPQLAPALKTLASPLVAPVDVTVPCGDSDPNFLVGGFEIDGDLCVNHGGEDWDSVDFAQPNADVQVDGFDDHTSFTQGDSENNDPSTWHIDGPTPNGKTDIGTAYAYSKTVGDDVYGYFAFTNSSTSGGTQQYDVEYNQNEATVNANGATVVVREPGDLLFRFASTGNDPLVFVADSGALIYTLESSSDWSDADCFSVIDSDPAGGWCTLPIPPDAFTADASDDGLFQEGSILISAFFEEGTCTGVFGTTQIRSVTGNSFETSALKDYVLPLDVTTPSNCGSLRIEKRDAVTHALVGGAIFSIEGDPRPGGSPDDVLCVYDGTQAALDDILADATDDPDVEALLTAACDDLIADGNSDGVITIPEAEAGSYLVTELVAPPGYLLDPTDNSETVEVGEAGTPTANVTVTFDNHKQWLPLDISKTAAGTVNVRYLWGIEKMIAPSAAGPWSNGTTVGAPLIKTVPAGGDTRLYYRVVVTEEGVDRTAYLVTGTIDVDNPNTGDVTATISDSLSDVGTCVVTAIGAVDVDPDLALPLTTDVPGGGTTTYHYACALGDNLAVVPTSNTASVVWDRSDYPQTVDDIGASGNYPPETDTVDLTFEETEFDKTVVVDDDHFDFPGGWTITWGDEEDGTYESPVYSIETGTQPGTCSAVITNTATVSAAVVVPVDARVTGPVPLSDSESGQVCVNAVPIVLPPKQQPHPHVLPNTGGPDAWVLATGLAMLLGGGALLLADQRRKRRS
jgi:LPXTG-motif cell wall-anchored protein